jgi:hypothetical protein
MAEERIEEHKHVVSETEEGTSESHSHKIVERDREVEEEEPEVTTIIKETTTIEETD